MKSFDFFTCTTCQDLTPTSARSTKDFNVCDTCNNKEIFKCDNCELFYPTSEQHKEEMHSCNLCVAFCDYDDAEDYKHKFTAEEQIEEIKTRYKQKNLINGIQL